MSDKCTCIMDQDGQCEPCKQLVYAFVENMSRVQMELMQELKRISVNFKEGHESGMKELRERRKCRACEINYSDWAFSQLLKKMVPEWGLETSVNLFQKAKGLFGKMAFPLTEKVLRDFQ